MVQNVGNLDKIIRIVIGMVLIGYGIAFESWIGIIGIIPLATAAMGWCPAYLPFGIKTCRSEGKHKK